eukprot:scaffold7.g3372.t1
MGVNTLWKLLAAEEVVQKYAGLNPADYAALVRAVDGAVIAVDLAMWLMQAELQKELLPHFSREERCMKVAFERALQWLRHGCLPVIVVEGTAPVEKRGAHEARHLSRTGVAGGGSAAGRKNGQFQRLARLVGDLLKELGLPVIQAPGEAEAACAALQAAGAVDACASFDSDTLLYGAETVYHTLKLSTNDLKNCEVQRVSMTSVRAQLGIAAGGTRALAVIAMLAGSDYDLDGAQGVGSAGALAVARHLIGGDADDARVLERLEALLVAPPDPRLLLLDKCTGCVTCGHEGGRKGKIKRHTAKNPCPCCLESESGECRATASLQCQCTFHRLEGERRVARIVERVRRDPSFPQEARRALAVFDSQRSEAERAVAQQLAALGVRQGQRLSWRVWAVGSCLAALLHRPRVLGVFDYIEARRQQLLWDLPAVRSKMLPALMEWDLQQQAAGAVAAAGSSSAGVELRAAEVQKVHGVRGTKPSAEDEERHWRYVLRWERTQLDTEGLGTLEVRNKLCNSPGKAGQASEAAPGDDDGDGGEALASQMQLGTQAEGAEEVLEALSVVEFDERWLKQQPAEHRAVRQSAVKALLPALEAAWQQRGAAGGSTKQKSASRPSAKRGSSKTKAGEPPESALTQFLVQRRAGELLHEPLEPARPPQAAAAQGGKPNKGSSGRQPVRRGLGSIHDAAAASGGAAAQAVRAALALPDLPALPSPGTLSYLMARHVIKRPAEAATGAVEDLTGGGSEGAPSSHDTRQLQQEQQLRQEQQPRQEQQRQRPQISPSKRPRSTPGSPSDDIAVLLSSPGSPSVLPLVQRLDRQQQQQQQQQVGTCSGTIQAQRQQQQQQHGEHGAAQAHGRRSSGAIERAGADIRRLLSSFQATAAGATSGNTAALPNTAGGGGTGEPAWEVEGGAQGRRQAAEVVDLVTPPRALGLQPAPHIQPGLVPRVQVCQQQQLAGEDEVVDLTQGSP